MKKSTDWWEQISEDIKISFRMYLYICDDFKKSDIVDKTNQIINEKVKEMVNDGRMLSKIASDPNHPVWNTEKQESNETAKTFLSKIIHSFLFDLLFKEIEEIYESKMRTR